MLNTNWRETKIYKALAANHPHSDSENLLNRPEVMDKIESILNDKTTTPKDFTLHDADHSFRVAEMMWEIIPLNTQNILTEFELCLLLLSAYLHDIGMSPEFDTVIRHKDFLTSKNKSILSNSEIDDFQKWIDNDSKTKSIDIRKEEVNSNEEIANYILTYYTRSKHNDWSESWIKKHLSDTTLNGYLSWQDDIILICKSHHYGLDHLKSEKFEPKPIGNKSRIHLRYVSMCLRLADVMENDPKRTPNVIFNHRSIDPNSVKYWLKDEQFTLRRIENVFTIHARPTMAYIHKAIEETANSIEDELKVCSELIRIKPLEYSSFEKLNNYDWPIEPIIHKDIKPRNDAYIYIQGGFRPNTSKILELLGGSQLYGNPIWAYRELIQNAFDAVKERIAYGIINNSSDPNQLEFKLGSLYSIDLKLEKREDGHWLSCKDQGVGMTKSIIEKFFLESGSSKRHEISELERKCKEKNYYFGRTGQFGIGVLSYFMIAEKLIVKTKRDLNTGYIDSESKALKFELNGTHDFGELQKLNSLEIGTEIEMKLRSEIEDQIKQWDGKFSDFLKEIIAKCPCNLNYSSLNGDAIEFKYGWTKNKIDIKNKILNQFKKDAFSESNFENSFITQNKKNELILNNNLAKEASAYINENLNFLFTEGTIEGLGKYRIFIPYFNLEKGNCFVFMKENLKGNKNYISKINKGFFWTPQFSSINFSLKGIKISVFDRENKTIPRNRQASFVELDIEYIQANTLAVSRHHLEIGDNFKNYLDVIEEKIYQLIQANIKLFDNCYGSINRYYTSEQLKENFWLFESNEKDETKSTFNWQEIKYPITSERGYYDNHKKIYFKKKRVKVIREIGAFSDRKRFNWFDNKIGTYVLGNRTFHGKLFFGLNAFIILTNSPRIKTIQELNQINLPSKWKEILFVAYNEFDKTELLLNTNHPNISLYNHHLFMEFSKNGVKLAKENFANREELFTLLIHLISNYNQDNWTVLCEKNKVMMKYLFKKLKASRFLILGNSDLFQVTHRDWTIVSEEEYTVLLPKHAEDEFTIKYDLK